MTPLPPTPLGSRHHICLYLEMVKAEAGSLTKEGRLRSRHSLGQRSAIGILHRSLLLVVSLRAGDLGTEYKKA